MTGVSLLAALIVVLQQLSMVIPPISGFSISLVLLPIVLGAVVYGPGSGALLGGIFGAVVYINCVTGADAGGAMVFQANPILCFAVVMGKGIACGLVSGLVHDLVKTAAPRAAVVLSAAVCPIVNTGIFVICMLAFYMDILAQWAGGGNVLGYIFTGLLLCNFVPEFLINIFFGSAIHRIVRTMH